MAFPSSLIGVHTPSDAPFSPASPVTLPSRTAGDALPSAAQLSIDVYETATEIFILAPLGGVTESDVSVEITDDVVRIAGKRLSPLPVTDRDILIQECYFGPFSRSIVLPDSADTRNAHASFKKNILIIQIPKHEKAKTRVLNIDV